MNAQAGGQGRVLPPVYFLLALILMVCLHLFLPIIQLIPFPFRYIGAVPVAAALLLVVWAALLFKQAGTTIKPFQQSSALVVKGPYRLSRNPIYVGMVGALMGVGVLLGSLSPFAVIPLFAWLIDRRFIRAEEAALEQTFESAYREYKARVRRWL